MFVLFIMILGFYTTDSPTDDDTGLEDGFCTGDTCTFGGTSHEADIILNTDFQDPMTANAESAGTPKGAPLFGLPNWLLWIIAIAVTLTVLVIGYIIERFNP